jgi:23S rRNA (pseudouridine1915-N3)-methyltransferase
LKFRLIKIGKISYPEITALTAMYETRLRAFGKFEKIELKDAAELQRALQGARSEHPYIALDERGKDFTSAEFAQLLGGMRDDPGIKTLSFVIGGPHGLTPEMRAEARAVWRLSKLTFTSDLAWLLLWEQIYRAQNILAGTGYHHE